MKLPNLKNVKLPQTGKFKNTPGAKYIKAGLGVIIALLIGAFGLEISNNDWDLGKLLSGKSMQESKVKRADDGTILIGKCDPDKKYNCDDFKTQEEAQEILDDCGTNDVHALDRDKDGIACEDLPKAK